MHPINVWLLSSKLQVTHLDLVEQTEDVERRMILAGVAILIFLSEFRGPLNLANQRFCWFSFDRTNHFPGDFKSHNVE